MIRLTAVIEQEGQAPKALTHESSSRSIIIGREPTCEFQLPLSTVSRQHARILEEDGVYTIEDLGSTHGTQVGDRPLTAGQKRVLRSGDNIVLTRAKITCTIEEERDDAVPAGEATQAMAARAVQGILGRLGDAKQEGPYLRILVGVGEGSRFVLHGGSEWALGRSSDCECVLGDANVSRRHAVVKRDWNGFTIHDLGSKNGVLINDRRISRPRRLRDQDEITIGPMRLVFVDPDAELLAALKDVPGFGVEEAESEELEMAPELDGAAPLGLDEPPSDALPSGDPEEEAAEAEAEALTNLDPELLENPEPQVKLDGLILAVVGLVILVAGFVLYALLGS